MTGQQINNYILKLIVLSAWIFSGTNSCVLKQESNFKLNETALVTFIVQNISDSLKLNVYTLPIIKSSKFNETTFVNQTYNRKQFVIPCEYPTAVYFTVGNSSFTGLIAPDDSLEVFINLKNVEQVDTITFKGITQEICKYYYEKKRFLKYQDLRMPLNQVSSNPVQILKNTDSLMRNELVFLERYIQKSKLPNWFIQTEKNQIIYLCNSFKDAQETYFKKYLKRSFNPEPEYYRSIDTLEINNSQAIFSYWYFDFLKNHLAYKNIRTNGISTKEWMDLTTKTKLSTAQENLSGEVRDIFDYEALSSYLNWTKKLGDYDKLFSKYKSDFSIQYYLNDLIKKRSLLTDSLVKNRNDDYRNIAKNTLKENDSIPNFYLPDENGKFYSPKNFQDGIIYINFWATWCKPCIASIPDKNILVQKFKNENVIFLNICISSEKKSWEKLISEKGMKGINLYANENWSNILKQRYTISEIPAYFLTKKGEIFRAFCDGPKSIEDDIRVVLNSNAM